MQRETLLRPVGEARYNIEGQVVLRLTRHTRTDLPSLDRPKPGYVSRSDNRECIHDVNRRKRPPATPSCHFSNMYALCVDHAYMPHVPICNITSSANAAQHLSENVNMITADDPRQRQP